MKQPLPAQWDAVAPKVTGDVTEKRYRGALRMLGEGSRGLTLDVGCGPGRLLRLLEKSQTSTTVGLDISFRALVRSRQRFSLSALLVAGDGARLPFTDESFQTVLSTDTLEHLTSPEHGLQEMARVLKPNGRLVITTPGKLESVASALGIYQSFQPFDQAVPFAKVRDVLRSSNVRIRKFEFHPPSLGHLIYSLIVGRSHKRRWLARSDDELDTVSLKKPLRHPLVKIGRLVDGLLALPLGLLLRILPPSVAQYAAQDVQIVAVKEQETAST